MGCLGRGVVFGGLRIGINQNIITPHVRFGLGIPRTKITPHHIENGQCALNITLFTVRIHHRIVRNGIRSHRFRHTIITLILFVPSATNLLVVVVLLFVGVVFIQHGG